MGEDDYSWLMDQYPAPTVDTFDPSVMGSVTNYGGTTDFTMPGVETGTVDPWDRQAMGDLNAYGLDPNAINAALAAGGSGGGNSSVLASLAKLLGFGGGSGGGNSWLPALLSMLGIGAGAYLNHSASTDAARQITDSINAANDKVTGILQGNNALFQPYMDIGKQGVAALSAMPNSNIAGNFNPLGTGRGIKLGALAGR
jgi:uncharacterized spore protein YtfJ